MADLISLTFLHLQQLWVINPQNLQLYMLNTGQSLSTTFFSNCLSRVTKHLHLLHCCKYVTDRMFSKRNFTKKKKKKKSLLRWRQSHWQVRLFSDDCDQSKNYFVAFSYLQKSFFRVYCIPSASDRSRVSPLVFCSPAALITHDKRSNTETGSIRI